MILALAGGVGGARLALGLSEVLAPQMLVVAVNTGDDFEHLGLHISPDLDTVMYTLAGINDPVQGWGIAGETWNFMRALEKLDGQTWFRLGDRDLATHVERTTRLRMGQSLSAVTQRLCAQLEVRHAVAPMSDDRVRTVVHTATGPLAFQDYFVRRRAEPPVERIEFDGVGDARMSPALAAALASSELEAIVLCPSNPYLSIAPILAVPGVREALAQRRVPSIAVSPIIGGRALKGPAAKIMRELGATPSSLAIAEFYRGLIDALVLDDTDADLEDGVSSLAIQPIVTRTVMHDAAARKNLAHNHRLGALVVGTHKPRKRAMSVCLVLPLKSLHDGKTRLSSALDADKRAALIERLLAHVLDQAAVFPGLQHTILVSACEQARARAEQRGASVLDEPVPGLNPALGRALLTVRALKYDKMMIVPCDLPLVDADDLRCLSGAASSQAIAIAPDRSGLGTNGICLPARSEFAFSFGEDSFARHSATVARLRLQVARVERPRLAFDVDTPADLWHLTTWNLLLRHQCQPLRSCVSAAHHGTPKRVLPFWLPR